MADIPYQATALRTRACRSESCDPPPAKIARRFDKLEFSLRPSVGERSICFSGSPTVTYRRLNRRQHVRHPIASPRSDDIPISSRFHQASQKKLCVFKGLVTFHTDKNVKANNLSQVFLTLLIPCTTEKIANFAYPVEKRRRTLKF